MLGLLGCGACSSDGGPATSSGPSNQAGSAGSGGGSSSGGAKSSGGTTGTGGYDPALAAQCSIDSTGNDCRTCLAATCCSDVEKCFDDAACMAAFTTYQTCYNDPSEVDKAGCFSTFARFARGDANAHQNLVNCVIATCDVCGGPGIL